MTSSGIKIVRNNIGLKPWKATGDIVNSYIQKVYKSNGIKNEMLPSKINLSEPASKDPYRLQKQRPHGTATATQPRLKGCTPNSKSLGISENLLTSIYSNSKGGNLAANKKLTKSPNYKIYGSRRLSSNASSSRGSLFRRYEERRRYRAPPSNQLNFLTRSFGTHNSSLCNEGFSSVFKYGTPVRNQHMKRSSETANNPIVMEVSSAIQRDLMLIDDSLKGRIALGRDQTAKQRAQSIKAGKLDPLERWNHPPSPYHFFSSGDQPAVPYVEFGAQQRKQQNRNVKLVNIVRPGMLPKPHYDAPSSRQSLAINCAPSRLTTPSKPKYPDKKLTEPILGMRSKCSPISRLPVISAPKMQDKKLAAPILGMKPKYETISSIPIRGITKTQNQRVPAPKLAGNAKNCPTVRVQPTIKSKHQNEDLAAPVLVKKVNTKLTKLAKPRLTDLLNVTPPPPVKTAPTSSLLAAAVLKNVQGRISRSPYHQKNCYI